MRVLLAEDTIEEQVKVKTLLERKGCEVTIVDKGEDALKLLENQKYDLIILDNILKDFTEGLYVARRIRAVDKNTPVIMYSSDKDIDKSASEINVSFSKKDISLLESLIRKHSGQKSYDNMPPTQAFLEYSLEILHSCLTPNGFKDAETSFGKLENMLKQENVEQIYLDRVNEAKSTLQEINKRFDVNADVFSRDYIKPLEKMRDILLKVQEDFSRRYN